jgi:hypothetical protein
LNSIEPTNPAGDRPGTPHRKKNSLDLSHPLASIRARFPLGGTCDKVLTVFVKYQSTSVEQTEEPKPVNLGPQIAKARGVTSPQRDFV